VNRKYALTWEEALNVMEPYGDGSPFVVCRLCGFVVNIKMARLHIVERHPAVPVDFGFKCVYCGRMEASANDLIDRCRDGDRCHVLRYKKKLSDVQNALEAGLLKAELKLKLRALKQALEEGNTEEATRIAGQLLELTGMGGGRG
jgi:hypothetical protein